MENEEAGKVEELIVTYRDGSKDMWEGVYYEIIDNLLCIWWLDHEESIPMDVVKIVSACLP